MHWAASKGKKNIIEMLVDFSKSKSRSLLNAQDNIVGWTPLHVHVHSSFYSSIFFVVDSPRYV